MRTLALWRERERENVGRKRNDRNERQLAKLRTLILDAVAADGARVALLP